MKKKINLLLTFYKSFCVFAIVISLICAYYVYTFGASIYFSLFCFKIITAAFIFYYIKEYKTKEFYFYKNLGISVKSLWIFSFLLDFTVYFVVVIIALNLYEKPA